MKISVKRLKQIIKEEMENIAEYERAHEGKKCGAVHPGMEHDDWAEGEVSFLMEGDKEYHACVAKTTQELLKDPKQTNNPAMARTIAKKKCAHLKKQDESLQEEYSVTNEELEDILAEDDWDFLEEEDLYED